MSCQASRSSIPGRDTAVQWFHPDRRSAGKIRSVVLVAIRPRLVHRFREDDGTLRRRQPVKFPNRRAEPNILTRVCSSRGEAGGLYVMNSVAIGSIAGYASERLFGAIRKAATPATNAYHRNRTGSDCLP